MPKAAIEAGGVTEVLPVGRMPSVISARLG